MEVCGFLLLNKPTGITSAKLLNQLKKYLPKRTKVGHAGTLDKFASGLLIVGISRKATRLLPHIMQCTKQYAVTAKLGVSTDTLDSTGQVISQQESSHVTEAQIKQAINSFLPSYTQTPPLFSAKKHNGDRLSDLVRSGIQVQQLEAIARAKAKRVYLSDLVLHSSTLPELNFSVMVSHGTYIRSLVRDVGDRLKTGAVTTSLRRTAIGPWRLDQGVELASIDIVHDLIPVDSVCSNLEI